jgi:hypothetical protein
VKSSKIAEKDRQLEKLKEDVALLEEERDHMEGRFKSVRGNASSSQVPSAHVKSLISFLLL